ncbi:MAG: hypothetical protein WA948_11485, partial [Pontixanthobacter sp.]
RLPPLSTDAANCGSGIAWRSNGRNRMLGIMSCVRSDRAVAAALTSITARAPFFGGVRVDALGSQLPARVGQCVCIPARNEAEELPRTLAAMRIAVERHADSTALVVVLNDTTDRSGDILRVWLACTGFHHVLVQVSFDPIMADAPHCRRLAMDIGDAVAPSGMLLTTDADTCVTQDWITQNIRQLREAPALVCGTVDIQPDALAGLAPSVIACGDVEASYRAATERLWQLWAHAPAPRLHVNAMGASLAIRAEDYRAVGRLPVPPVAEDKALAAACLRNGVRVIEADTVRAVTSGRIDARAAGGMGDALRDRAISPDPLCDEALVPVGILQARAAAWNGLRDIHPIATARREYFAALDTAPELQTPRMRLSDVKRELAKAKAPAAQIDAPAEAAMADLS